MYIKLLRNKDWWILISYIKRIKIQQRITFFDYTIKGNIVIVICTTKWNFKRGKSRDRY